MTVWKIYCLASGIISGEVSSLLLGASEETELPAGVFVGRDSNWRIRDSSEKQKGPAERFRNQASPQKSLTFCIFLLRIAGEVFTKEQIYRAVCKDYLLDDSNIMAFVRKLRKKIEPDPDAPKYILTIWGIGYKFNDQL